MKKVSFLSNDQMKKVIGGLRSTCDFISADGSIRHVTCASDVSTCQDSADDICGQDDNCGYADCY